MWDDSVGVTPLKVFLEWIAALLQMGVALAYVQRYLRLHQEVLLIFALGMVNLGLAGAAVTAHSSFYDFFFWLGQGYRLVAYNCFLAGVWWLARGGPAQASGEYSAA